MSTKFALIDEAQIHLAEMRVRSMLADIVQLRVMAARGSNRDTGAPLSATDMALLDQHGVTYTVVHVLP